MILCRLYLEIMVTVAAVSRLNMMSLVSVELLGIVRLWGSHFMLHHVVLEIEMLILNFRWVLFMHIGRLSNASERLLVLSNVIVIIMRRGCSLELVRRVV